MEKVFKYIKECGIVNDPYKITFQKTQKGNWAVFYNNIHQGVFVLKEYLSDDQVKKHNKNALKK